MALTGTKALIVWCQQVTHGYKDVEIRNMTSSWRDGLAFCAILHHYRPDLINFDKLAKENIAENNDLAFTVAEQELGIPALLDVEDMVELTVPDKLSIMTYVSQYYQYFRDKVPGQIPKRHTSKRHSPYTMEDLPRKKLTPGVKAAKEVIGATPNPAVGKGTVDRFCANCGKTVYLMERLQVEGKLFHRICFTCTACATQLRMGTYRYIPIEDKFYCDRHYRQRTTSASSDDSLKVQHESHKNEQDALKNLLESLENKRRTVKEKESDNLIMKHDSVHQRIADARKKFADTSNSSTSYQSKDESMDHSPKNIQRHPPPRPVHLPGRELNLHEGAADPNTVTPHSDVKRTGLGNAERGGPPSRPTNLPGHMHTDSPVMPGHHIKSRNQARGFLNNLLPKLDKSDEKRPDNPQEDSENHIYETPFLCGSSKVENDKREEESAIFENPRYRESLKMESKPIYENQGPSILTLRNEKSVEDLEKKSSEGEASLYHDDEFSSDGEYKSKMKGNRNKKLILKVRRKSKKNNKNSAVPMNSEVGGETDAKLYNSNKEQDETEPPHPAEAPQAVFIDPDSCEEDEDRIEINKIEIEADHKSNICLIGEKEQEAGNNIENMEGVQFEKEEIASIMSKDIENDALKFQGKEKSLQDSDLYCIENKEESIVSIETKENENSIGTEERIDEDMGGEGFRKEEVTHPESNDVGGNRCDSKDIVDVAVDVPADEEVKSGDADRNEGFLVAEEAADESNNSAAEPKNEKVLKHINPFSDSGDEEQESHQQKTKDKHSLNPLEVDSGDEEQESHQQKTKDKHILNPFEVDSGDEDTENGCEKDSSYSIDDGIGRAVSRKTKLVPGEGPRTKLSAEELAEHQVKIDNIKRELMTYEKEEPKPKNPFEESDDELLETDDTKCHNANEKESGTEHPKRLVLKVKKKRRAPRPPDGLVIAHAEPSATDEKFNDNIKLKETMEENVEDKSSLAPADPLETFKTYIQNSEVEIRKRLDSKASRIAHQDDLEYKQATSPMSASCPALNEFNPLENHTVDENSMVSDEGAHNENAVQKGKTENEAVPIKEKPPKRPAPPVPKGTVPYREKPSSGNDVIEPKENDQVIEVTKVIEKEQGEVKKQAKKMKDKKKGKEKDPGKVNKYSQDDGLKRKEKKQEKDKLNAKEKSKLNEKEKYKMNGKEKVRKNGKEKRNGLGLENKEKGNGQDEGMQEINIQGNESGDINDENVKLKRTYSVVEEKELSLDDIGTELKEIEEKQRLLEQRGVKMEKRLRDQLHGEPEEDYMITWFDLVTEKNKLLRRENELIYMSQEIEYHGYQKKIEFELRLLMEKDDSLKTDEDRNVEEQLLQQLVSYVSRRNRIVEKMEQDRIREREEDEQIQMIMQAQGLRKQKKKKAGKKVSSGSIFYS